jgi:hypothetical protein
VYCINTPAAATAYVLNGLFEKKPLLAHVYTALTAIKNIAVIPFACLLAFALIGCSTKRERIPEAATPSAPVVAAPPAPPAPVLALPAPLPTVSSMAEYRRRAAQLILDANPGASFTGEQPPMWYGIATVTISFNADGGLREVDLMRRSSISPEVNAMAVEAVRRVANFGSVSNLPRPWQFNETFLYNDARLFQLDTIVAKR